MFVEEQLPEVVNKFKGFPSIETEAVEILQIVKATGKEGFYNMSKEEAKDLILANDYKLTNED